jgi:thiol-disulfide isomerase/thioredoxin
MAFPIVAHSGAAVDPLESLRVQPFQETIPAPTLSLKGTDGRPLRLEDLKGKVVFLNFWATWCGPCREEMPAMERLYREYRQHGLAVVAVNFQESKDKVLRFLEELRISFPAALDPDGTAAHIFAVRGLPVSFLLSRDGRILWRAIGSRDWDSPDARAYFKKTLQATQP